MLQFTLKGNLRATATVSDTIPFFEGHFPGNPVLPAIAIVEASCEFLREVTHSPEAFRAPLVIKNAKFSRPVLPNMSVELEATRKDKDWEVRWFDLQAKGEPIALVVVTG